MTALRMIMKTFKTIVSGLGPYFILSTGRLESLQPFNVSVRLSVRHNWKAFKTLKNNRKKAGPFSVGTEAAVSDR